MYEFFDTDIMPEEKGVEAVARQIKMTGRAYPIFDLARLILNSGDRFHVRFKMKEGEHPVELVRCAADGSYWLSRAEAVRHFWNSKAFTEYYKREEVQVEPPKGNFSVVAVCGLSGAVLGPPNFHGYLKNLHDLHARRFSRMPIDLYKRKIEMVRDEETMQKWKDSLSSEVQYTYLRGDAENPLVLKSMAEVERHFMNTHGEAAFEALKEALLPGNIDAKLLSGALLNLLKRTVDRQRKVPIQLVKALSPLLEHAGLKFFKLDKKETYVARSRPRALDLGADMSPRIGQIVSFVRNNPGKDLNVLVSMLVGSPAAADASEPSPEEVAVLKDLRWLIREGYVTEFSDGGLQIIANKGGVFHPVAPTGGGKKPAEAKPKDQGKAKERAPRQRRRSWRRRRLWLKLPRPERKPEPPLGAAVWRRRLAGKSDAAKRRLLASLDDPGLRRRLRRS